MWEDRILFLDGEALVIDKPAGLAVHPGPATPRSLEDHLGDLRFGFRRPPTLVHRLDRDTSGCLLLARNPRAHGFFQRAFEAQQAQKVYLAVLEGVPTDEGGTIELALAKVSTRETGWRMVPDPAGRPAATDWRLLASRGGRALVEFRPRTGRTHQVRVHAASGIGIPIVGDPVYGRGDTPMLLHSSTLRLERPGKNPVAAHAPLPASFLAAGFDEGTPGTEA